MPLHVVTLNSNGFAPPNVTASQRAAAERWGAEYHEFKQPWVKTTSPSDFFGVKFDLCDLPFPQPCRVVWLDSDVIVRADCPSLFELVPADCFGGVLNNQDGNELQERVAIEYWEYLQGRYDCTPDEHIAYKPDRYVNGGVLVFTLPDHALAFRLPKAWAECGIITRPVHPMIEQTAMNRVLTGGPIHILPHTYNRIGAEPWRSGPRMTSYIYHFANVGEMCGNKRERMAAIEWEAV